MSNQTSWTVRPFLTPDADDDPLGVYIVEQVYDALTPRYRIAEPETPELDAVHAENARCAKLIEAAPELLAALKHLTAEINLSKLNIRKDFHLINAHTCALKAIHKAEAK